MNFLRVANWGEKGQNDVDKEANVDGIVKNKPLFALLRLEGQMVWHENAHNNQQKQYEKVPKDLYRIVWHNYALISLVHRVGCIWVKSRKIVKNCLNLTSQSIYLTLKRLVLVFRVIAVIGGRRRRFIFTCVVIREIQLLLAFLKSHLQIGGPLCW